MVRTANWAGFDEASTKFLTSQNHQTQLTYKSIFKLAQRYFNMTGQEMLDSKKTDKTYEWEKRVVDLKAWVKTQRNNKGELYSDSAASTAVNCIRSFFDYYRLPLVFNQHESRKIGGKNKRKTQDYMLTNADLPKMIYFADLEKKYVVSMGKSVGLRINDFLGFTYGTFRSLNLNDPAPVFMGEILTGKERVPAYPFIDADALPIVKTVLEANRDKSNDERVITVKDEAVNAMLQDLAVKSGIQLGGKHLRFHCFRKYLIDRLSACMSESKWKQIVGKAVSEDAYVSSFELRNCYIKTMELTTVCSPIVDSNLQKELDSLKTKLESKEKIIEALAESSANMKEELVIIKSVLPPLVTMYEERLNNMVKALPVRQMELRNGADDPDIKSAVQHLQTEIPRTENALKVLRGLTQKT
jgi:hypothetical protein